MKSPWSPSCSRQRPAAEFLYATKAPTPRQGATSSLGTVDTGNGWRCRHSHVSRDWHTALIPAFLGDNREGQYQRRHTPMQPHDGVPCTAPGHGKAECPSYPTQTKTLLVVTDSHSLLAAVTKGPHSHTDWTEDRIWQRLLSLMRAGWSVQLHFATNIAEYMLTSLQISMRRRPRQPGNTRSME
ncbi:putative RNase H [Trypanosoma cruzi]|uniref:Putative RNase H n=1 Tax=Trypanosoma cruzi TaxID=5693 RepID=A0A2V2XJW5_TRYCR|nr:putative RNase H [Trypanosoma cruzi]RNC41306.1 ribonuclease HI [Trypanosoma cruzi]